MLKTAFIISSIKPYELSLKATIESIRKYAKINYDIIVCSDKQIDGITTIIDNEKSGENRAYNLLSNYICDNNYDNMIMISDDYEFVDGTNFNLLLQELYETKHGFLASSTVDCPTCFSTSKLPFPEYSPYGRVYDPGFDIPIFPIPRFPVCTTEFLRTKLNKQIFSKNITSGYADVYLGFYLYANGISFHESNNSKLRFMNHIHN